MKLEIYMSKKFLKAKEERTRLEVSQELRLMTVKSLYKQGSVIKLKATVLMFEGR